MINGNIDFDILYKFLENEKFQQLDMNEIMISN